MQIEGEELTGFPQSGDVGCAPEVLDDGEAVAPALEEFAKRRVEAAEAVGERWDAAEEAIGVAGGASGKASRVAGQRNHVSFSNKARRKRVPRVGRAVLLKKDQVRSKARSDEVEEGGRAERSAADSGKGRFGGEDEGRGVSGGHWGPPGVVVWFGGQFLPQRAQRAQRKQRC
jgi:hypothetical protein